jgi:hypothetical protein
VAHVRVLAYTLREVQQFEQRRAEMLRQAARDLRGSLRNVTAGPTPRARYVIPPPEVRDVDPSTVHFNPTPVAAPRFPYPFGEAR